ncbi:MAG: helix-turn-helix transcriptional regulator [Fusicatenibacter sp.]|nr:AraC family transcriptional regulator [Fusicatenibacter sp.]
MEYDSVLNYVKTVLGNMHIPFVLCEAPFDHLPKIDFGLREHLFCDYDDIQIAQDFVKTCRERTLYYFTDAYLCSYAYLKLPDPQKQQILIVGPYTSIKITESNYANILDTLPIQGDLSSFLKTYYYQIAYAGSESLLKNLINTLAETIWGGSGHYNVCKASQRLSSHDLSCRKKQSGKETADQTSFAMSESPGLIEARCRFENQCMHAVSQGNTSLVDKLLANQDEIRYIPRFSRTLDEYKYYLKTFNTLLRKAAEQGIVHPVFIRHLSLEYDKKIDALISLSDHSLERSMLYDYCLLVQNHSCKNYSPIVQKVIHQIHLSLTDELNLGLLSKQFCVSAGYLSMLFKKETGVTLTSYISRRRIELATYYLETTNLQIQEIAVCCGIHDINYFTRLFKKNTGMTPREYRNVVLHSKAGKNMEKNHDQKSTLVFF